MVAPYSLNGFSSNGFSSSTKIFQPTVTALNRWSVADKQLPAVDKIKHIHVYDFDNTLFKSPLPNPKVWNGQTIGLLQSQDALTSGGWWHDSRILAATGDGVEKELLKAWEGWWNEKVVELVKLSMQQKDALTVLLTGRSEHGFSSLIKKMVGSKNLDFEIICLKPAVGPNNERFNSTLHFKQVFLEVLLDTYRESEEIRIYEDRVKHVKSFKDFLADWNKRQIGSPRGQVEAEVVQVADEATMLDPVTETAEVQRLINDHNAAISKGRRGSRLQIKKTVFYTGYLIGQADTQKLLDLAELPANAKDTEMKFLANNILITPRPASNSILEKVGGMGNKLLWEVTGTAVFENKIWAASVRPVPQSTKYYTENPVPLVVIALRKGARPIDANRIQNWQPVSPEKALLFETTVGEKVLLRIEDEDSQENEYESLFPNKTNRRKHTQDDDHHGRRQHPGHGHGHHGGRGGKFFRGGSSRGGGFRGSGRGRGRGGRGGGGGGGGGNNYYRSLDDAGPSMPQQNQNFAAEVPYDDYTPPKAYAPQHQGYPAQQQAPVSHAPAGHYQQYPQYQYQQAGPPQPQPHGGGYAPDGSMMYY